MIKIIILFIYLIPNINYSQTIDVISEELDKVQTHITNKNYSQGLSILNDLLKKNPNDSNIYRNYAELLLDLKHHDLALTNIKKAILLSKSTPSNHLIAGNIYRDQKNFTEAQKAYQQTIKLNPGMGEAYTEFTLLNLQHNFMRDAQRLAELAYRFNPDSWQNIVLKANIAEQKGDSKLAQKIFLKGIQKFPYNEHLLNTFAQFYLSINETAKAIIILEEANARFGESIQRNLLLGDSAFVQNQQTNAIKYYETINSTYKELKLPISPLIQWRLYNLYRANNNIEKSYALLQNALELDPMNQLYISSFYQYLLSTDNQQLRISLSKHLENIANEERKKGINDYYLTVLQKIIALNPSNNKIRKQLINYAKIQNNEAYLQTLLDQSLDQEPNNVALQNTLKLRDHLTKTQRLQTNTQKIYQYTNKIFIDDNICYFTRSVQQEFDNIELIYPKIISKVELKQNFDQESRTMFQTNTNYNLISYMYVDSLGSTISVDIFDKTGIPLATFKKGFDSKNLTTILIDFVKYINQQIPSIGSIQKRLADSRFQINIGSRHSITTNQQVVIMNKDFIPLTTARVLNVTAHDSIIQQNETSLRGIDIESAYIVPLQYVPSLNTNKNNQSVTNLFINNIDQVTQKRYPLQIKLPQP